MKRSLLIAGLLTPGFVLLSGACYRPPGQSRHPENERGQDLSARPVRGCWRGLRCLRRRLHVPERRSGERRAGLPAARQTHSGRPAFMSAIVYGTEGHPSSWGYQVREHDEILVEHDWNDDPLGSSGTDRTVCETFTPEASRSPHDIWVSRRAPNAGWSARRSTEELADRGGCVSSAPAGLTRRATAPRSARSRCGSLRALPSSAHQHGAYGLLARTYLARPPADTPSAPTPQRAPPHPHRSNLEPPPPTQHRSWTPATGEHPSHTSNIEMLRSPSEPARSSRQRGCRRPR